MEVTETNDLLSPATWQALADEYLQDVGRWADPSTKGWFQLREHVYANTSSDITPETGWVCSWSRTRDYHWEVRKDADDLVDSYAALQAYADRVDIFHKDIPLSDLHHDHPYFTRVDNLVFRAWHDTGHLEHNLSFTANDELRLFGKQANGLTPAAVDALFCESVYQLAACLVLDGYPEQQYCRALGPVGRAVRDVLISAFG